MVPHLTTAPTGPLRELERNFLDHPGDIDQLFRSPWQGTVAPICASIGLRNSGFKLAPVGVNPCPGGFNDPGNASMPPCGRAAHAVLDEAVA